ncbi:MAG: phosphoenolpyruvate kinase [Thermoanaerobaculia bacterium]
MNAPTPLPAELTEALAGRLSTANSAVAARYPGETARRQPVHTFYGGAHLFRSDTMPKIGAAALSALEEYAPSSDLLKSVLDLPESLAPLISRRIAARLRTQPVEDYRLDFEDGYGNRSDAEEDSHAISAAREVVTGMAAGTLSSSIGLRIKPLTEELRARSLRTLDLFVTQMVRDAGRLPDNFVVTLPKVTAPEQVAAIAEIFEALERGLSLPAGALALEIMVETPQSIIGPAGEISIGGLVSAAGGRCLAAHFGTYDYTASLNITAAHQHMLHPACDFARHAMQAALAGTGVWISDGATNVLPIPPHRGEDRTLTGREIARNRAAVHAAWKLHYDHVRHSLANAFYQGWDLHPAQLPTRYAALYAFFLEGLDAASARLTNFVEKAGQATLVGDVFDDAATGQGLLSFFLRASACGAITEQEAVEKSGLTLEELRSRSFVRILAGRRAAAVRGRETGNGSRATKGSETAAVPRGQLDRESKD